jgi:hypothetical protein
MDNNKSSYDIDNRVLKGEKVPCPNCGEILIYQKVDSGKHPSIICINGDYNVLLNVKNNILEKLGLTKRKKSNN